MLTALAIACLGQGTPVASISYQGKFEGLYQHFSLEPLFIEPEQLFQADQHSQSKLVDLVVKLINQRAILQQQILRKLDEVKKLSQENFTGII